jgi:hypothetical protein
MCIYQSKVRSKSRSNKQFAYLTYCNNILNVSEQRISHIQAMYVHVHAQLYDTMYNVYLHVHM